MKDYRKISSVDVARVSKSSRERRQEDCRACVVQLAHKRDTMSRARTSREGTSGL